MNRPARECQAGEGDVDSLRFLGGSVMYGRRCWGII